MPKSKMEIMRRAVKRIEQDDSLRASLGTLKAAGRMTWDDVAELLREHDPALLATCVAEYITGTYYLKSELTDFVMEGWQ